MRRAGEGTAWFPQPAQPVYCTPVGLSRENAIRMWDTTYVTELVLQKADYSGWHYVTS